MSVSISGIPATMKLDSASSIKLLNLDSYNTMEKHRQPTNTNILVCESKSILPLAGKFDTAVQTWTKYVTAIFYLPQQSTGNLIGYETGVTLEMIQIRDEHIAAILEAPVPCPKLTCSPEWANPKTISWTFTMKKVSSRWHKTQDARHSTWKAGGRSAWCTGVSWHNQASWKWVSSIVVIPTRDCQKTRICLDMCSRIAAVYRERHHANLPIPDEIIHEIHTAPKCSENWTSTKHIELHHESRYPPHLLHTKVYTGIHNSCSTSHQHLKSSRMSSSRSCLSVDGINNISDELWWQSWETRRSVRSHTSASGREQLDLKHVKICLNGNGL